MNRHDATGLAVAAAEAVGLQQPENRESGVVVAAVRHPQPAPDDFVPTFRGLHCESVLLQGEHRAGTEQTDRKNDNYQAQADVREADHQGSQRFR